MEKSCCGVHIMGKAIGSSVIHYGGILIPLVEHSGRRDLQRGWAKVPKRCGSEDRYAVWFTGSTGRDESDSQGKPAASFENEDKAG